MSGFFSYLLLLGTAALDASAASRITPDDLSRLPEPASMHVEFLRDIEPIFASHCYGCHGPEKQRGDLRLDVKAIALRGGSSGPAIIAGNSAESPLIHLVGGLVNAMIMPESGDPLSDSQIALLRAWIDQGASWPDGLEPSDFLQRDQHWAFQKVIRPPLPQVTGSEWPLTPVDLFILDRLEKAGLRPSPDADHRTLIRRLSLDLLGLPPTPEDVSAFISDPGEDAYERLVEKLLSSPQYGERWARHWLDVVRFAESNGFETNLERKNAWPYRDYVIQSFNGNKPYDQFVLEQLAGDVIGVKEATGFIVGGPWDAVKSPDVSLTMQQRMDELHDMVSTTGSTFLGLTVGCARCHNHKFDPVSQKDYYAMQASFAGVQHGETALQPPDYQDNLAKARQLEKRLAAIEMMLTDFEPLADAGCNSATQIDPADLRARVHPRLNVERFKPTKARFVRFTIHATSDLEPCIDELEVYSAESTPRNVALASFGTSVSASGTYPNSELHRLEHINDGHGGNSRSWISNERGKGWVQLQFSEPILINKVLWGRDREGKFSDRLPTDYRVEVALEPDCWKLVADSNDRHAYDLDRKTEPSPFPAGLSGADRTRLKELHAEKDQLVRHIASLTTVPMVYAGKFETPEPTYLLYRGDPMQKREPVAPGGIRGIGPSLEQSADTPDRERRLSLAKWMVHPDNPLTARVMVNRLWQHHFGRGIVDTPSDFGLNGARPTHPELLDWLASDFVQRGWDVKALHRMIVLSRAYRQDSEPDTTAVAVDADASLLWRFPPRRLEAEPLRDSILAVSGALDERMGGPGFDLFEPNSNYVKVYTPIKEFGPAEWRRMVYHSKPRMRLDDTFGAFDCPDAGQIAPKRNSSTTPLQALSLLNSPFILQQSTLFAQRVRTEAGAAPADQVCRAFALALNRQPSASEAEAAERLIREHGLVHFCRALYNANEFLYLF